VHTCAPLEDSFFIPLSPHSTGDLAVYPIAEAVYSALLISSFTSDSSQWIAGYHTSAQLCGGNPSQLTGTMICAVRSISTPIHAFEKME
jgi:hypothetical protein